MPTAYSHLAGREVDTWSEEWRLECECLSLLRRYPTRSQKHLYLYGVSDRRQLFTFNPRTGKEELAEDHKLRWADQKHPPLMKHRGLASADKLLADARRLHEILNKTTQ